MKHDEYVHLIDVNEFRNKILEYEFSEDFDKMYNSTVFSEYSDDRYKNAIRHGLALSSLLISQCESLVAIKVEKENIFENNTDKSEDMFVNVNEIIKKFSDMADRGTLLTGENITQEDLLMQIIGTIVKSAMEG